jgi:hypothetical protein
LVQRENGKDLVFMGNTAPYPADTECFTWLERKGDDFPYYRGRPTEITSSRWCLVLLAVAVAFALLVLPPPFLRSPGGSFTTAVFYIVIPLASLAWAAGSGWTAIFRPIRIRDIFLMFGFALLNYVVTFAVGIIMMQLTETVANQASGTAAALQGAGLALFFARTGIQLFGEELMSILPFLALMYWLSGRLGLGRKLAIVIATIVVALLFAAEHLPTYNFNVLQTVLGVGVARIVLLLPYIITKNILVSTGAHILFDWSSFAFAIFAAGNVGGGATE